MAASQVTRPSLLIRIRDPQDSEAWDEFLELYTPLVYGFCRRRGLQDADASDLTQNVMHRVVRAIQSFEYDPKRGSFRAWLFTITRNEWGRFLSNEDRRDVATGSAEMQDLLAKQAESDEEKTTWEEDFQSILFSQAAQRIRREFREPTWSAFWQSMVEGQSVQQVAQQLALSDGAVYVARCRVLRRLKDEISRLEELT